MLTVAPFFLTLAPAVKLVESSVAVVAVIVNLLVVDVAV